MRALGAAPPGRRGRDPGQCGCKWERTRSPCWAERPPAPRGNTAASRGRPARAAEGVRLSASCGSWPGAAGRGRPQGSAGSRGGLAARGRRPPQRLLPRGPQWLLPFPLVKGARWSVLSQRGTDLPREICPQAERGRGLASRDSQEPVPRGLMYKPAKAGALGPRWPPFPELITQVVTLVEQGLGLSFLRFQGDDGKQFGGCVWHTVC